MSRQKKLTDQDREEIARLYLGGAVTMGELGAAFGVSAVSVHKALHRLMPGVSFERGCRRRKVPVERRREIAERRQGGERLRVLAEEFGVSIQTICKIAHHRCPLDAGALVATLLPTPASEVISPPSLARLTAGR